MEKTTNKYRREYLYKVKCECGTIKELTLHTVTSGNSKSCGCLAKELLVIRNETSNSVFAKKHGLSKNRIYQTAYNVLLRSKGNVPDRLKHIYDGVRITQDLGETQLEIYESLIRVPGYFDGAQIDRIDNSVGYTLTHPFHKEREYEFYDTKIHRKCKCLGNLRWVTPKENIMNSRVCKDMEFYETFAVTRSNFKITCKSRGWKFDEFIEIFSGEIQKPSNNKKYFYKYNVHIHEK